MAKVIITNNAERAIILGKVVLSPGSNLIEDSKVKTWAKEIEAHEELSLESSEGASDKSLGNLSVKKAVPMIKEMNDEEVLMKWKSSEEEGQKRAAILKSIDSKLKEIEDHLVQKDDK